MSSPYGGNAASFPTAAQIPSDLDLPETVNLMPPVEAALDRTAYLNARQLARSVLEWTEVLQVSGSYPTPTCVAWDPFNRKWLIGASGSLHTSCGVFINTGLDARVSSLWTEVTGADAISGETNAFVGDVLADPTTANVYLALAVGPTINFFIYRSAGGGAWSQKYTPGGGIGNRTTGRLAYFTAAAGVSSGGGPFVAAVAATTAAQCGITGSADGSTWGDVAATYGGAQGLTNPASGWSIAQSPTSMIAVPQQTTSDLSYLRATVSGGVITWTKTAFGGGVVSPGDIPYAIAYGQTVNGTTFQQQGTYIVAVQANAGGTKFLASTDDGVTWAIIATITSRKVVNLAAIGFLFVATTEETGGGVDRTIFSIDGAATWHLTDAQDTNAGGSPAYYQQPRIAASDVGFGMTNTVHFRFSGQNGIPAAIS